METMLVPKGTNLLIELDPVYRSSLIARPDNVEDERPESGVIAGLGGMVDPDEYPMGVRVGLKTSAGYHWAVGEKKMCVIDASEVRCFFDEGMDPIASA